MLRALMIALLLAQSFATAAVAQQRDCKELPQTITGKAWAIDGDTLAMIADGRRTPDIRLFGIQAPELRDKATGLESREGMRSRAALDDLLAEAGNGATCTAIEWDRYCRVVAWCAVVIAPAQGPTNISVAMLERGQSYVFTAYALRPPQGEEIATLIAAERSARRERRGLWREWLGPHD